MAGALVFQCTACRSLGSAVDVVVASDGASAALVCPSCRFSCWLPVSGRGEAGVDASVVVAARPALPAASVTAPTSAAPTHAPGTAMTVAASQSLAQPTPGENDVASLALVPLASLNGTGLALTGAGLEAADRVRERLARQPAPSTEQVTLHERFDRLLSGNWHAESEHKSLLKMAALAGELAFIGGRYRAVLDIVRDEPRAKAAQQELLTLAMATMTQSKDLGSPGGAPERSAGRTAAIVGLVVVFLIGGAFFVKTVIDTVGKLEATNQ